MTLEEYLTTFCGPHCYGEQDENGVDVSRSTLVAHYDQQPARFAGRDCPAFCPPVERDEHGVDVSAIRANLRLSPTERLRRGDRRTRLAKWMFDCDRWALRGSAKR